MAPSTCTPSGTRTRHRSGSTSPALCVSKEPQSRAVITWTWTVKSTSRWAALCSLGEVSLLAGHTGRPSCPSGKRQQLHWTTPSNQSQLSTRDPRPRVHSPNTDSARRYHDRPPTHGSCLGPPVPHPKAGGESTITQYATLHLAAWTTRVSNTSRDYLKHPKVTRCIPETRV